MKKIEMYIEHIKEELDGACYYAEKYIELKNSKPQWAKMFHDMATQELNHAQNFKDMGESVYAEISKTYMPEDTAEHWERCLHRYADKSAKIKVMLSM